MPLQLASIRIEGASLLRRSFLESLCSPYLLPRASSSSAVGLTAALGLIAVAQSLSADLTAMDVFDKVDVTLQPAKDVPKDADKRAQQELSDVVLTLKNRSRLLLKSSTDVGDGEGSASVQARVRNVFGGAEVFNGSATIGTRTRKAFNVSLTAPILANPDHIFSLGAYALDRDCTAWWAAYEGLRGARASILSSTAQGISHEFALQADWRHIGRLRPFASRSIRRLAGHSLKCSVQHTYMRDTRDDPLFQATTGSLTKVVNEVSGFGSDVHHWKAELEASRARTLGHGYAWSLGASAGLLKTLDARPSHLSDRFQLGGPLSVRMFRFNSLGPKDGGDSLGGDAFWSAGCSLFAPLPLRPHWPLKLHAFFNAGQLTQIDQTIPLQPPALSPLLQPSASAGVGLMFSQGPLRVELNAGLPLAARRGDGARKGVQLGIGISFL
ncbi:hypothetical protein IE81DRAFT_285050 [Ceraceosorus guamensis]|uniref:Bacterial surface antigen (D15) domain-containing protein n=1 Tax=Ceraceosorus guamensis TaxID=1522189 RepID=A0A316W820_9BASI|nr:hypothetical protein IE81DRAFT_285050 [Ceraceosorus guamensis]PWN45972.1 hypothetical protein IE81DRAFT_285050 [Ceraceosorus guamensis]